MEWNKFKKLAALGMAGAMLLGSIMTASAADSDFPASGSTKTDVTFKAGEIVDPDPGPGPGPGPEPEPPIDPIGDEYLQVVHAPDFSFGEVKIVSEEMNYPAKAQYMLDKSKDPVEKSYYPNYVKLIDQRGNDAGWNVSVKMDGQLKVAADKVSTVATPVLDGSRIVINKATINSDNTDDPTELSKIKRFADGTVVNPDTSVTIMEAPVLAGSGTWYNTFGSESDLVTKDSGQKDGSNNPIPVQENGIDLLFNPNIILNIPENVTPSAAAYSAKLVWTLNNVPAIP